MLDEGRAGRSPRESRPWEVAGALRGEAEGRLRVRPPCCSRHRIASEGDWHAPGSDCLSCTLSLALGASFLSSDCFVEESDSHAALATVAPKTHGRFLSCPFWKIQIQPRGGLPTTQGGAGCVPAKEGRVRRSLIAGYRCRSCSHWRGIRPVRRTSHLPSGSQGVLAQLSAPTPVATVPGPDERDPSSGPMLLQSLTRPHSGLWPQGRSWQRLLLSHRARLHPPRSAPANTCPAAGPTGL